MECINFAFPNHDWDHEDGDGRQHYLRMLATKKEVQINLFINTIFNLILLSPLPLLCKMIFDLSLSNWINMKILIIPDHSIAERHEILMDSIGTLDMENEAYTKAWIFSWIFYIVTIMCSILQYVCFYFYNEKYHPMAMILKKEPVSCPSNVNI